MDEIKSLLERERIPMDKDGAEKLEQYFALLLAWNQRMDLTSVPEADMPARHFLDSLLPLRETEHFFSGARIIDVGTGAGFPGMALAAARSDLQVTLLEAQGKRCQFLHAVKDALKMENVQVVQGRAEEAGRLDGYREQFDLAIARAVAGLNVLMEYLLPFVKAGGYALCWKGPAVKEEMTDGQAAAEKLGGRIGSILDMTAAGAGGHLLVPVHKIEKTLPQYPRKNGIPAKRPLRADKN